LPLRFSPLLGHFHIFAFCFTYFRYATHYFQSYFAFRSNILIQPLISHDAIIDKIATISMMILKDYADIVLMLFAIVSSTTNRPYIESAGGAAKRSDIYAAVQRK
jgi:hypothetical protein